MSDYIVLITSIIGVKGEVVSLPNNSQTQERLSRKLIAPVYDSKPNETKVIEPEVVKVTKPRVKKAKR